MLNEIYGQKRINETPDVRYAEYTVIDDDAQSAGEIGGEKAVIRYEYESGMTEMYYQYIYVEDIG